MSSYETTKSLNKAKNEDKNAPKQQDAQGDNPNKQLENEAQLFGVQKTIEVPSTSRKVPDYLKATRFPTI